MGDALGHFREVTPAPRIGVMFTSDTSRHRKGDTRMTHYVITKKLHLHLTGAVTS